MISYCGFRKRFGNVTAVHHLDLSIGAGETLALIGPNGSGKTTTLKSLVGLVRPTTGRITVAGQDATEAGPAARALLGYLPQRLTFPDGATARETLRFYARLRGCRDVPVDRLLARVGLADDSDRAVDGYSGGMRQRLGLAVALLGDPPALVLDEPSAALDPTGALMVRDILRGFRQEGRTVLLSSHDLVEVASLADRVAVFAAGRMTACDTLGGLEHTSGCRGLESVYRALTSGLRPEPGRGERVAA